jgi:hypothetical protein
VAQHNHSGGVVVRLRVDAKEGSVGARGEGAACLQHGIALVHVEGGGGSGSLEQA